MPDLTPLETLRLALIELEESKRLILCRPELEAGVRAAIAELCPFEHLIEVRTSPYLPDDTAALILDPNAIEGAVRAILQRGLHEQRKQWADERAERFRRQLEADWAFTARLNLPPDPRSAVIITVM